VEKNPAINKLQMWKIKIGKNTGTEDGEMCCRDLDPAWTELAGLADPLALGQVHSITALLHFFQGPRQRL
jgi:hypothetical protein